MFSYVRRDLVRNPRRTLAALVGVVLGVALFSGVLFFIDGSGATMTKRALEPLALDMQRVITTPLGGGPSLEERVSGPSSLRAGQRATVTLTVRNAAAQRANDVVVNDQPPAPLSYVAGSTTLRGKPLPDAGGRSPLAQGLARTGLNIGRVPARGTVKLTYTVRARRAVGNIGSLRLRGTISSRENTVPTPANGSGQLTPQELRARIARIPGVAAADVLSFVDLPPASLHAGGSTANGPVRVFGLDRGYAQRYPSIQLTSGSFAPGSALLSAEASRTLGAGQGSAVKLTLPGRAAPLVAPVSGITDLSRANPLFYSRNSNKLEEFIYVPDSVIISPATFERKIIPAFQATAATSAGIVKSPPVREVDVLVDRPLLDSDPASALAQTKAIARAINRIAPGQDYLIDNISNTLQVASDDAAVGKQMFLFLGLPGVLLAAFLAAYAGGILAAAQRRERASLRIRGAHRGHLQRMLVYRALVLAGIGASLGVGLGLVSTMAILGPGTLFAAAPKDLVVSALIGIGAGIVTTALALYVPGRRSLTREVSRERAELSTAPVPGWRRWRLDLALLTAAAIAELLAIRAGAFDPRITSVSEGESASLPSQLLLAPLVAWCGGVLLSARALPALGARLPLPSAPRFGPLIRGTLARSLKRRSWALAGGVVGIGLVTALGVALAIFSGTYDAAKASDSRFVVGSDLRITPSVVSARPHPPGFASSLRVPGVSAVSPVVSQPENSVLISRYNQGAEQLTAIDPASFERVAPLSDSFFVDRSASSALAALRADPQAILIDSAAADDLSIETGDSVKLLLARGTRHETKRSFHVVGQFERFPGFPQGTNIVANLRYYGRATGTRHADFFLAGTTDHGHAGIARATAALQAGPGRSDPLRIDSTETALDKDQSSLTALNVNGLLDLDSLYALLISAAAVAIFVFGLMLQRRREYVTLLAQGMLSGELRRLVLAEVALVAASGLAAGLVVGTGMGYLLVHVLRPLFILDPGMTFPVGKVALVAGLVIAAAVASALLAAALLRRLSPTELLREG
ncbi:MAG TPA: FtsX-like permease family protein [Solirubrobacterales bacterium]|nr:FtsX-like permease family protein [Solirubrobacterales bacterium]